MPDGIRVGSELVAGGEGEGAAQPQSPLLLSPHARHLPQHPLPPPPRMWGPLKQPRVLRSVAGVELVWMVSVGKCRGLL